MLFSCSFTCRLGCHGVEHDYCVLWYSFSWSWLPSTPAWPEFLTTVTTRLTSSRALSKGGSLHTGWYVPKITLLTWHLFLSSQDLFGSDLCLLHWLKQSASCLFTSAWPFVAWINSEGMMLCVVCICSLTCFLLLPAGLLHLLHV